MMMSCYDHYFQGLSTWSSPRPSDARAANVPSPATRLRCSEPLPVPALLTPDGTPSPAKGPSPGTPPEVQGRQVPRRRPARVSRRRRRPPSFPIVFFCDFSRSAPGTIHSDMTFAIFDPPFSTQNRIASLAELSKF